MNDLNKRLAALEEQAPAGRGELVDVGKIIARVYDAPYEPCLVRMSPEFEDALERIYGAGEAYSDG